MKHFLCQPVKTFYIIFLKKKSYLVIAAMCKLCDSYRSVNWNRYKQFKF